MGLSVGGRHRDRCLGVCTTHEFGRSVKLLTQPRIGKRMVTDIKRSDIAELHHALRETPYQAKRADRQRYSIGLAGGNQETTPALSRSGDGAAPSKRSISWLLRASPDHDRSQAKYLMVAGSNPAPQPTKTPLIQHLIGVFISGQSRSECVSECPRNGMQNNSRHLQPSPDVFIRSRVHGGASYLSGVGLLLGSWEFVRLSAWDVVLAKRPPISWWTLS